MHAPASGPGHVRALDALGEFAHPSEELGRSPVGHYLFDGQAPDVGNVEIVIRPGRASGVARPPARFRTPFPRGPTRRRRYDVRRS
jgi:hypothetical protein